ncbi:MAG: hypothetical protein AAGA81_22840 [Acidobacteriota bacterium]
MTLDAHDVRIFVPAQNFELSRRFYARLGWVENWCNGGLAELELAGQRLFLQDFYVKDWADNFMIHVTVEDVDACYAQAREVVAEGEFEPARSQAPKDEPYGARVAYVWDPSGVLIHFAQPTEKT